MGFYPFFPQTLPLSGGTLTGPLTVPGVTDTAGLSVTGATSLAGVTATGSIVAGSSPGGPLMELVATTGAAGVALINGTQNLAGPWTAPNDGAMHRVLITGEKTVTSAETGGQVVVTLTDPGGSVHNFQIQPGGSGLGGVTNSAAAYTVEANTTVTVKQATALTVGASVQWAEIWGS